MRLTVVIPVYNEISTLDEIVRRVQEVSIEKEILLVDDHSTDGSRERVLELSKVENIRVFLHDSNQGKGAALRTGFAAADGEIILVQDADLEYDPVDYLKIVQPIESGMADVVYGSRFVGGDMHRVLYFWHSLGNRVLTLMSNLFTNLNITDMEVCYKAFRREVIQSLHLVEDRFGFEPEVTAKIAHSRDDMGRPLRVYEVGISYAGRTYEEGKKIGWRDGFWALWCIFKYNLWARPRVLPR